MASSLIDIPNKTSVVRKIQATTDNVRYTFRGEWHPDTVYNRYDYVYSPKHPGFLYVATTSGTSQSEKWGLSSLDEPVWNMLVPSVYDNNLQFVPVEVTEEVANRARRWKPGIRFNVGDLVAPSKGPMVVQGQDDQYFVFKVNKCVVNPDWPRTARAYLSDNDITWECHVSYGKLLPPARWREPMYKELVEIMDFLRLHEEMYFDDLTYKYADQIRVRGTSIKEVIAEFGYNYITDAVGLTERELQTSLEYISLIHYLKGHESGLSIVFELLGVSARWEEWWEATPPGIPDTWKLWVDLDISKAKSGIANKIINFTRQYVYPVMQEFEVTYSVNLIQLGIAIGGFMEAEYRVNLESGLLLMQGVGVFIDQSYDFTLKAVVHPVIGKEDIHVGEVFGFRSIFGDIGTWGSNWIRYDYNHHNRIPIAGDDGYPKGDGYHATDISEPEALVLISAAEPREGEDYT